MRRNAVEILAPAGSWESMAAAFNAGADAVYIGGSRFGARAFADNLDEARMVEAIRYAHLHGRKLYMTVNTLMKEEELSELYAYLRPYYEAGLDAVIVQDMGVFSFVKKYFPGLHIHASTQMTVTGAEGAKILAALGAERVVTARELSLEEIKEIRAHIPEDMEIESFIHGAMCISYSGRCLLSNYFTGRDANQGACTHPCRWKYAVVEETRPGEYMPVYENDRGTFIFNSKDLCMIGHVPEMIEAGIDSFKIEGRMKTALYVATVARTYRRAIDDYLKSPEEYRKNLEWYREEIGKCTYREFTTGFYFGKPDADTQIYDASTYVKNYTYLGTVEAVDGRGFVKIEQKNKFTAGQVLEVMKPDGRNVPARVEAIYDEEGVSVDSAPHPKQILYVDLGGAADVHDILRIKL